MPKFRFRLDPVLRVRERAEDEASREFALAQRAVDEAQRSIDDLVKRRDDARGILRNNHGAMTIEDLRGAYAHCDFLDRAINAQYAVFHQARVVAEIERNKLMAATKEKKVLETLKSRQLETFEYAQALAEQVELDDMNSRRFDRVSPSEVAQ